LLDTSKCVSWQNKGLTWLHSVDMFVALVVKCSGLVFPRSLNGVGLKFLLNMMGVG